jgi:hypothetical protein
LIFTFKKFELSNRIICFYLIYCFLSDLVLSKLSIKYFNTEIYSYRLFTIVEFLSLSLFIYFSINNTKFKKIILVSFVIFSISLIIDSFTSNLDQFDSIPSGLESILILNSSLLLLYEKAINAPLNNKITSSAIITFGFIIFFAGTFFLFILSQKNFNDIVFLNSYGYLVAFFNIIKNVFIIFGIMNSRSIIIKSNKNLQNI